MAVLALTCVKRRIENGQIKTDKENFKNITNLTESLVKKILSEKKENGLLGNTFSTGEAMQVSQRTKGDREERGGGKRCLYPFLLASKHLIHSVSYRAFYLIFKMLLPCLKCILLTSNLYLSMPNAFVKLFSTAIYLRNSRLLQLQPTLFNHMQFAPLFCAFISPLKLDCCCRSGSANHSC